MESYTYTYMESSNIIFNRIALSWSNMFALCENSKIQSQIRTRYCDCRHTHTQRTLHSSFKIYDKSQYTPDKFTTEMKQITRLIDPLLCFQYIEIDFDSKHSIDRYLFSSSLLLLLLFYFESLVLLNLYCRCFYYYSRSIL